MRSDERGAEEAPSAVTPPSAAGAPDAAAAPPTNMTLWGRRASRMYLIVAGIALLAMLVETLLGHPGAGSIFAAILAAPWSVLVAKFLPDLPRDWPLAAGLAIRMLPLALFMLLNAAIIAGIAARSERDMRGVVSRAGVLLVLLVLAGSSGCGLTTSQRVVIVQPTSTLFLGNGGRLEIYFTFDLSTDPTWRKYRGKIVRVSDLTVMGDFGNATGGLFGTPTAIDIGIAVLPGVEPLSLDGQAIWGPLHLEIDQNEQVDWPEGQRLLHGPRSTMGREIAGDGVFALHTLTAFASPTLGGPTIENLRLGAVLEVK